MGDDKECRECSQTERVRQFPGRGTIANLATLYRTGTGQTNERVNIKLLSVGRVQREGAKKRKAKLENRRLNESV